MFVFLFVKISSKVFSMCLKARETYYMKILTKLFHKNSYLFTHLFLFVCLFIIALFSSFISDSTEVVFGNCIFI